MEPKKIVRWTLSVLGLMLAGACVGGGLFVALHFGTLPVLEYQDTLSWRKTNGTVVSRTLSHGVDCYVTYNYTVKGVTHKGNHTRTIGHHFHYEDHGHAELCRHLAKKLGPGEIEVWYDPERPRTSALKKTFVGDFWLSMHSFESLALVSLGGALVFWVTHFMGAAFALAGADATLLSLTTLPISTVRLFNGHLGALLPLLCGVLFTILALACAIQIQFIRACLSLPGRSEFKMPDAWWVTREDDVIPPEPQETGSNRSTGTSVNVNIA